MRLRTADGYMSIAAPDADPLAMEADTVQCCHCGAHFPKKPPKIVTKTLTPLEAEFLESLGKTVRGFCTRCNAPTCGRSCMECVPEDILLENYEKGRPLDYRPIVG